MVLRSDLNNWINGNKSSIDRSGLINIARYFEYGSDPEDIEEDMGDHYE